MSGEKQTQGELKKTLGFGDLMGIGVGQIIGSGIMTLTGITIALTGAGTPYAFILAAVLVLCPNTVLAVLGSAVPATGGMYTYVRDYIGKKTGFFYLALLVAGQLVLAMFGITFAAYVGDLIPGVNETLIAFGILTLCYIMNMMGVEMAAKLQNFLVIVLVAAMALFIIFGLPKVEWSRFVGMDNIMPNGFVSFLTGASLLTFATGGAEFLSELGGEMKNPGRDLPRPLYIFFVVGGGMFAVASTLNATFTWCTKGLLIASEEGWLPKQCAYISKRGVPVVLLTIFYIVGAVPILTGLDLESISRLGNGLSLIYVLFPISTGYIIYKKNPEAMARSTFKIGKTPLMIITTIGLAGYVMAAILNFADIQNAGMMLVIFFAAVIIYAFLREKHVNKVAEEKRLAALGKAE